MVLAIAMGITSVYAADEPAEVKDTYEYDGVTYVNVGDKNFSTNQTAYYKAMLGNALNSKVDDFGAYSISDIWTKLAFYMAHYNNRSDNAPYFFHFLDRIYESEDFADPRGVLLNPGNELQASVHND